MTAPPSAPMPSAGSAPGSSPAAGAPASRRSAAPLRYWIDVVRVLVARDHRARYKNTAMGMVWAVASPILFLLTFTFLFGVVLRVDIPNYASFAFTGIIAWTWFQTSLNEGAACISHNASLVGQPRFPIETLPMVPVVSNLINLAASLPLLAVVILVDGGSFGWTAAFLPLILLVQFAFTLSLVYFVSAANVGFRDVQHILPVLLQLGYFMTPIFYGLEQIPEQVRWLMALNPMAQIIQAHRAALGGEVPNLGALLAVLLASGVLLALGYRFFRRAAETFLEEI